MTAAKKANRFNVSMPAWFRERAGKHAEAQGLTFAAYVRHVLRADMLVAGVDITAPKRSRKGTK